VTQKVERGAASGAGTLAPACDFVFCEALPTKSLILLAGRQKRYLRYQDFQLGNAVSH
jgi:hypothetical protein